MKFDRFARRKLLSHTFTILSGLAIVVILVPLASVLYTAVSLGAPSFSVGLFTQGLPVPCAPHAGITCPKGGLAWPIEGTLTLLGLASLVAVPIGIGGAIFSVEYGDRYSAARIVGLVADVLSGTPSIVVGAFVYSLVLLYAPNIVFSQISGSLTLAVLMTPIVTRTTETALRTVPRSVREAALALGISRWKITMRIVMVSALPGVLTGVLLAISRAAGEAAPLLLSDSSLRQCIALNQPCAAMPIMIFTFADSPYPNWISLAWAAALVLILLVLALSVLSRLVLERTARRMAGA
ncbi:MAG: phosphate ABC transporter permease PstA [Thermoplasmata archaeon]